MGATAKHRPLPWRNPRSHLINGRARRSARAEASNFQGKPVFFQSARRRARSDAPYHGIYEMSSRLPPALPSQWRRNRASSSCQTASRRTPLRCRYATPDLRLKPPKENRPDITPVLDNPHRRCSAWFKEEQTSGNSTGLVQPTVALRLRALRLPRALDPGRAPLKATLGVRRHCDYSSFTGRI